MLPQKFAANAPLTAEEMQCNMNVFLWPQHAKELNIDRQGYSNKSVANLVQTTQNRL
jgi:hypothetical protein